MYPFHHPHLLRFRFVFWGVFCSLLVGLLTPHPALAASYVVTKLADTNDGVCDADCSLREAITAANNSPADDTITFDPAANGTIVLTGALPTLTNNGRLYIFGNGTANTIISGNNVVRVFTIDHNPYAGLRFLTITAGHAIGDSGGGIYVDGGNLELTGVDILNNVADVNGGGIANNLSDTIMNGIHISGNTAAGNGGGFYNVGVFGGGGEGTFQNSTLNNNTATSGSGGGAYNSGGSISWKVSSINNNVAAAGSGGGIYSTNGQLYVDYSTVSSNSATSGGGIQSEAISLQVFRTVVTDNTATSGSGGGVFSSGKLNIAESTFSNNSALLGSGGGVDILNGTGRVDISVIRDNNAAIGGGIHFYNNAIWMNDSTVSGNSATTGGGINNEVGTIILNNSIIANSLSGGDCVLTSGTINSFSTLIEDGFGCVNGTLSDNLSGDPALNPDLTLQSGSAAVDAGNNSLIPANITTDIAGQTRIQNSFVDMGAFESPYQSTRPRPTPTAPNASSSGSTTSNAPVDTALCENLMLQSQGAMKGVMGFQNNSMGGIRGNTYCRPIVRDGQVITSLAEIGVQSVVDLGVIQAVDIYGLLPNGVSVTHFETPVHVCLKGNGQILFLNASGASRKVQSLLMTSEGAYRCADVMEAGTLVLVGHASDSFATSSNPAASTIINGDCSITILHSPLKLHTEPNISAAVITQLPYDLTLKATERVPGWYRVIYLNGQGWVSADFVRASGDCGN